MLPIGKLPAELLARLLAKNPINDTRVLLGPGIGLDCAVIEAGEDLLILKSDPITFATDEIGWYAVQVNANDIATTGASPRWLLTTLLLPEENTTPELVEKIGEQLFSACQEIGVTLVGGHTEITMGLGRPILVSTMIGEVSRTRLVTPRGALPGDCLLLTKGIPIEATALLAREYSERLYDLSNPYATLTSDELKEAQDFLYRPGISVLYDAQIAAQAGEVHAMHDPTEGGLYTALWELAEACEHSLWIEPSTVPVYPLSQRICQAFDMDPLGALASGALLLAAPTEEAGKIQSALQSRHTDCTQIGAILDTPGAPVAWQLVDGEYIILPQPRRDEIARLISE